MELRRLELRQNQERLRFHELERKSQEAEAKRNHEMLLSIMQNQQQQQNNMLNQQMQNMTALIEIMKKK